MKRPAGQDGPDEGVAGDKREKRDVTTLSAGELPVDAVAALSAGQLAVDVEGGWMQWGAGPEWEKQEPGFEEEASDEVVRRAARIREGTRDVVTRGPCCSCSTSSRSVFEYLRDLGEYERCDYIMTLCEEEGVLAEQIYWMEGEYCELFLESSPQGL